MAQQPQKEKLRFDSHIHDKPTSAMSMTFPEKLPAPPPGGHQRVLLPSLTFALVLVAMPLLLWSVDTAVIRHAGHVSSFGSYLLPTVTASARASDAAPAATAERIPDAAPASVKVSRSSPLSQAAGGSAAAVELEGVTGDGIAPVPGSEKVAAPRWLSVELEKNFTATLLSRWLEPGGEPCRDNRTTGVSIPGLDVGSGVVELAAGPVHEFVIHALDDAGNRRCLGGDYFETDLSGASWKSRPPVKDNTNGSYTIRLQVHPDFAGDYNLTVVLLFRSFEGLKFSPERFAFRRELRSIPIRFYRATGSSGGAAAAPPPKLQLCGAADFQSRDVWSGRWTRHARNDQCDIDHDGRYRCLDPAFPCPKPWCRGHLGALESNGWVYSAHCSFALFNQDAAWRCLRGRWLFFWGDSNHVDTIRNLLNFVLGIPEIRAVPRRLDANFTNPRNPGETVRITSLFNGHWNDTLNYQGLYSLQNQGFRELIRRYFSEDDRTPDVVVLNSGLHDGIYWHNIRGFAGGADYAAKFWEDILADIRARGKPAPAVFYRTTIATGGYARDLAFNPHKMEAFNGVLLEKLRARGLLTGGVVDEFDMTFPWHWDNRCNDGVHYGRAPAKARWRDGRIGHQYFVDLMLVHVLLNAICGRP